MPWNNFKLKAFNTYIVHKCCSMIMLIYILLHYHNIYTLPYGTSIPLHFTTFFYMYSWLCVCNIGITHLWGCFYVFYIILLLYLENTQLHVTFFAPSLLCISAFQLRYSFLWCHSFLACAHPDNHSTDEFKILHQGQHRHSNPQSKLTSNVTHQIRALWGKRKDVLYISIEKYKLLWTRKIKVTICNHKTDYPLHVWFVPDLVSMGQSMLLIYKKEEWGSKHSCCYRSQGLSGDICKLPG